jgi:hypothetical protein
MAKPEWLFDVLLLLHDAGLLHRDAIVARLGKSIRPEEAVRAHNQARHGSSQLPISDDELDSAVRNGKHLLIISSLSTATRGGYAKKDRNGTISLTMAGLHKLIKVKPHRLSLPLSADQSLVLSFNRIVAALKDNVNTYSGACNKGLMDALSIIHRVARGLSERDHEH